MFSIRFIANAGLLLEDGQNRVLIDGLFEEFMGFDAVPPHIKKAVLEGIPPFDDISFYVTTHCHPDHYSATWVRALYKSCPGMKMAPAPGAYAVEQGILEDLKEHPEQKVPDMLAEFTGYDKDGRLCFMPALTEDFCSSTDNRVQGIRWGEEDGICMAKLETKHLTDRYMAVPHEAVLLRMGGKTIWISADADPVFFARTFEENGPLMAFLQEKKLYPADIMVVNPFFIYMKPGIRFLKKMNPDQVLVYHVPVKGADLMRYGEVLRLGLKRCENQLSIIPLTEFDMRLEFPLENTTGL